VEYFNNILCISKPELTDGDDPIMSVAAYDSYLRRTPYIRVRKGGGYNCPALLAFDRLRKDLKEKAIAKYGDPHKFIVKENRLLRHLEPDYKAATFYREYQYADGNEIRPERQAEYCANATVLNAVAKFSVEISAQRKALGNKLEGVWEVVSNSVNSLDREQYPHTLPSNPIRLKEKLKKYQKEGYVALIHKGIGNNNARLITDKVEKLIMSIYCMENLPFGAWVHEDYLKFIAGNLQIVDAKTGEFFNRDDYYDHKKGNYISISRSTVSNILRNPANAVIIDRLRNNRIDHITKSAPFNHRHKPEYSLSKISADDRTFSRKTIDGKWFNAYAIFDVMSGVILSTVYSADKPNVEMVWDSLRAMYQFVEANNLMWPGEIEVENHLMKDIETELRDMFSYVTFCTPGLSRSKRAEHLIRGKKYGDEKRHQVGIGRWNQKGPYKIKSEGKDEDYKQPRLPIEQLIAEDRESIARYNNALHPDQDKYPGKTRMQVLIENINPDLGRPQKHKLMKYLGHKTETSIRNNDFAQVQYAFYALDNQQAIAKLKPGNYNVQAYYVPSADGNIENVYFYQGDTFISRATKIERYNEAKIERTEADERIRTNQAKRQAHFFNLSFLSIKKTRYIVLKNNYLQKY
jgi:hypothetical protein